MNEAVEQSAGEALGVKQPNVIVIKTAPMKAKNAFKLESVAMGGPDPANARVQPMSALGH